MARALNKLSATQLKGLSNTGRHSDGGGLYLSVSPTGTKSWVFVWTRQGTKREMGLGPYRDRGGVTLAEAREKASTYRAEVAAGRNPMKLRDRAGSPSFGAVADEFVDDMESGWRDAKHAAQWRMTLGNAYCKDIRKKSVADVDTNDVLSVLKPIWIAKPETASRLRGRIERVLSYAGAKGLRWGPNPAFWKGHLQDLLPVAPTLVRGHHAAMPFEDLPSFAQRLAAIEGIGARGLEFLLETVGRTGEIIGARWEEIDLEKALWIIPAGRMKANKLHRVPLTKKAVSIATLMEEIRMSDYLFPGDRKDRPLSNMAFAMLMRRMNLGHYTPHGFRSSFRDWCGDRTEFPREVAEAALAHRLGDKTEEVYRRGDALEKRRTLMESWSSYLADRGVASAGIGE
jgi:integrase